MNRLLLSSVFALSAFMSFSQTPPIGNSNSANTEISNTNKRLSFVIGVGSSYIPQTIYQDPGINKTNNSVIIEKAQQIKTNITVGVVYTPYLWEIKYKNGEKEVVFGIER